MIPKPVFKAFAEDVMKSIDSGGAELDSADPLSAHRRVGNNKSTYEADSTRTRQQSAQDRPPRAGYARPPQTRLTSSYDPQMAGDKYSALILADSKTHLV